MHSQKHALYNQNQFGGNQHQNHSELFRDQHKSLSAATFKVDNTIGERGNRLYRAPNRPNYDTFAATMTPQRNPATARGEAFSRDGGGGVRDTPPLFTQMAPRLSKQRQYFAASELPNIHQSQSFMAASRQPSHHFYKPDIGFGANDDERSTSKPQIEDTILVRNPTAFQTNYADRKIQHQQRKLQTNMPNIVPIEAKHHDSILMSFGAGGKTNLNKGLYQQKRNGQSAVRIGRRDYNQNDLKTAVKAVKEKLECQFELSDNHMLTDYANQAIGFGRGASQSDYNPLTFLPSHQIEIPEYIRQQIAMSASPVVTEISQDHSQVYFGIGNKIVVWDCSLKGQQCMQAAATTNFYNRNVDGAQQQNNGRAMKYPMPAEFSFEAQITSIMELRSKNRFSAWQQACEAANTISGSDFHFILVATIQQIVLLTIKSPQNIYGQNISIQETFLSRLQIGLPANCNMLVELEKVGRVFYAREGGRISELIFENTEADLKRNPNWMSQIKYGLISSHRKRILHVDHQKDNILLSALPEFLRQNNTNMVRQLRIDQQRNVLYSLSECDSGYMQGQTAVEIFDLGMFANEFKHVTKIQAWDLKQYLDPDSKLRKYEWALEHKIVDIQPISYTESLQANLMLTTSNCERIFIELSTEPRSEQIDHNSDQAMRQLEKLGLQSDFLIQEQIIPQSWQVLTVLRQYPEDNDILDNNAFAQKVAHSFFSEHRMPGRSNRIQAAKELQLSQFDNGNGLLVFNTIDTTASDQRYPMVDNHSSDLKLCFIQKNTGVFSHARKYQLEQNNFQLEIREQFSMIQLKQDEVEQNNFKHQNQDFNQEMIIMLSKVRAASQSSEALILMGSSSTAARSRNNVPVWGDNSLLVPYKHTSENEKQVYLQGSKLCALTSHRLIEITQLRPIDKLYNLLMSMQDLDKKLERLIDEFFDFAQTYTMEETCSMLIQIIADEQATYHTSHRIAHLFKTKIIQQREQSRHQQQNFLMRPPANNFSSLNQSRSLSQTRRGMPHQGNPNQIGGFISTANRTFHGGRLSMSQSQNRMNKQQQMSIIDESTSLSGLLNEFDPSRGSEIHSRQINREITQIAQQLLFTYGDTVNQNQVQWCNDNHVRNIDASKLLAYSNKHKALYLYAYRILRPIWRMKVTNYARVDHLDRQQFNTDQLKPVIAKLFNFQKFVLDHEQQLVGVSCKEGQHLFPPSCPLSEELTSVLSWETHQREAVEVAEKHSLAELSAFLQRCIDVIELFFFIESDLEKQNRRFQEFLQNLDMITLDTLSKQEFCNFVEQEASASTTVKILLERLTSMEATDDAQMAEQTLRTKQKKFSEACPTLFSPEESKVVLGTNMLFAASRETDLQAKNDLVNKAMDLLLQDPSKIDMAQIVPILAKERLFQQIVHLALQKIRPIRIRQIETTGEADRGSRDAQQIQDMLDMIVQIIDSLETAILGDKKSAIAYDNSGFMEIFRQAIQNMELQYKLRMRDNIVVQLANSETQEAIKHLLRAFLVKNRDVEFICQKVSSQLVREQCRKFVREQAQRQLFSKRQFNNVYKVLSKARQADELSEIVLKVLTQQVKLMQIDFNSNDAELNDQPGANLVECRLNCEERSSLAKKTLQLMEDQQRGTLNLAAQSNTSAAFPNEKITGATGGQIQMRQQLLMGLREIVGTLMAQSETMKSVKAKIDLIQGFLTTSRNKGSDRGPQEAEQYEYEVQAAQERIAELQEVDRILDFELLMSSYHGQELEQLCFANDLHDRTMHYLFNRSFKTVNERNQLEQKQQQKLESLVNDLKLYSSGDQEVFKAEFQRQMRTIFTRDILTEKKSLLFYAADLVTTRVIKYNLQDIIDSKSQNGSNQCVIWTHELILCDLRVPPSNLLNHYLFAMKQEFISEQMCFELCLSLIVFWCSILLVNTVSSKNRRNESADLRQIMYEDLCSHGASLYQKTIAGFCFDHIKAHKLSLLIKADEQACIYLFNQANKAMADLLCNNVSNFDNSQIVQLAAPSSSTQNRSNSGNIPQQMIQSAGPKVIDRTFTKPPAIVPSLVYKNIISGKGLNQQSKRVPSPMNYNQAAGAGNRTFTDKVAQPIIEPKLDERDKGCQLLMLGEQQQSAPQTQNRKHQSAKGGQNR